MAKKGRPTEYNADLGDTICARLADGESLRGICSDKDMPDRVTVYRWVISDSDIYATFRNQYATARKIQAETLADEIFDIADDGRNDWLERQDENGATGESVINHEHIQRSRLRVDTRKWFLSKVLPKFADKQQIENTHKFENISDEELENRIKALENELKSAD